MASASNLPPATAPLPPCRAFRYLRPMDDASNHPDQPLHLDVCAYRLAARADGDSEGTRSDPRGLGFVSPPLAVFGLVL